MLEIWMGPAASGKTTRCLECYRQELLASSTRGEIGRVIWLSPTHRSVQAVLKELLTPELTCCWAPGVMTFDQFAERILRGAGVTASLLNQAQRRMLIQSVIRDAEREGTLRHFRQVAHTAGFVNLVGRFISELKRDETWPEAFREVLEQKTASFKDLELCRLYERYQDRLHQWEKYDSEGRFWLARSELAKGHWQAFPEVSLVIVDGFTDFTRTQYEMLSLLANHATDMRLTLPGEENEQRVELFAKSQMAARIFAKQTRLTTPPVIRKFSARTETSSTAVETPGLVHLADSLFTPPRELTPLREAAGLACFSTLGPRAEIRETAKRVKKLLLAGVSAEEILVTTRHLDAVAPLIEDLWTDAGLPYYLDISRPVTTLPLAKALSTLLQVHQEDWSFRSLKKLLRHTPLQLSHRSHFSEVLPTLRRLNLRSGRLEILKTLEAQLIRKTADSDLDEQHRQETQAAWELLQDLDQTLGTLNRPRTYSDHVQQLLGTARELYLKRIPASESPTVDSAVTSDPAISEEQMQRQWDLLAGLLHEAAGFQDQLLSPETKTVSLAVFTEWVAEQFRWQTLPARKQRTGEVLVLAATDARHLQTPYLFVIGLQDGSFPGPGDHQPFYTEQERQEWNTLGIPLNVRASHHLDEMQFFYRLVTRAQRQLTLSYSHVSIKGQPQYASPYYQTIRTMFAGSDLVEEQLGQLSPVPEVGDLLTESDLRMQAVQRMRHSDGGLLQWWWQDSARHAACQSLLSTARMNAHRFEQQGFTSFEGLLRLPANRRELHEHYHASYTFSATQLESYANCPYRFFLESILHVDPMQTPRLATDHRKRGNIVHDLLAQLHSEEYHELLQAVTDGEPHLLTEKYLELLTARFEKNFSHGELQRVLDQIEQQLIQEWAELYTEQTRSYTEQLQHAWEDYPQPKYREISFGRPASAVPSKSTSVDGTAEEILSLPAVTFGKPPELVQIEGRIDRIDVGQVAGQEVFTLIDYKTGQPPRVNEAQVSKGTHLQLALYTVAVVRLKLLGPEAIPWQIGYWGIREEGFLPKFVNTRKKTPEPLAADFMEHWSEQLDRLLPQMVQAIRAGEFPVYNEDPHCTSRCPFQTVCRVGQVRAVSESLHKFWSFLPPESVEIE